MRVPWWRCVLLIMGLHCAGVAAQDGIIIDAEEVGEYSQLLSLSDEQRALADALLEGYELEIKRLKDRIDEINRQRQVEMEALDPADSTPQRHAEIETNAIQQVLDHAQSVFTANDHFLEDLEALLDEDQSGLWPRLLRVRRRHTFLDESRLPGADVDLARFLAPMDVRSSELDAAVIEYERKLDDVLAEREVQFETTLEMLASGVMTRMSELLTPEEQAAIEKHAYDQIETDISLIALNTRYTDRLALKLPPEHAATFRARAQEAVCGQHIRRDRIVETIYDRALSIPSLDEDQRAAIEPLRERFVTQASDADVAQALARIDLVMTNAKFELGRADADEVDDVGARWNEARLEYDRVVERCLARLRTELTATQIAEAGWTELFDENVYVKWWRYVRTLNAPAFEDH